MREWCRARSSVAQTQHGTLDELCSLVELTPTFQLQNEGVLDEKKDWWVCPGAAVGDGDCEQVFKDSDYAVACAF